MAAREVTNHVCMPKMNVISLGPAVHERRWKTWQGRRTYLGHLGPAGDVPSSTTTAVAISGVVRCAAPDREQAVDTDAAGLHHAGGCGSGAGSGAALHVPLRDVFALNNEQHKKGADVKNESNQ